MEEKKISLRECFRTMRSEKQYAKIIIANVINRFGDSVDAVAFGWLVYTITGSKEWLVVILGVNMLPTVLLQPFTGAWANFLNKKWVMVCADWGRGILVLLIAVLFLAGALTPVLLLVITVLNSCLESLRVPCAMALLPKVLRPENLKTAMSLNMTASRASELIGMGISGLIIAWLGLAGAVLVDAATFLASGLVLCRLQVPNDVRQAGGGYLKELGKGFSYLRGNSVVILMITLCFLLNLVENPMSSLRAAYIQEELRMAENALSAGSLLLSVGMLLGSLLYTVFFGRFAPRRVFVGSGVAIGLVYLALVLILPLQPELFRLVLYAAISLFYGMVSMTIDMALQVVMVQNVKGEFMGRIAGIFNSLACASSPLAAAVTAILIGFLPIWAFYLGVACVTVVLFLAIGQLKTMKQLKE